MAAVHVAGLLSGLFQPIAHNTPSSPPSRSYEILLSDIKFMAKYQWKYIVVDEVRSNLNGSVWGAVGGDKVGGVGVWGKAGISLLKQQLSRAAGSRT